jgi:hypothetical protein
MPLETDEPEILDATRSWSATQSAFRGTPHPGRRRYDVDCGWYDTTVNEYEGALCMVNEGDEMEELIGDFVRVLYQDHEIWLYCLGAATLDTRFALCRYAFLMTLSPLSSPRSR